MAAGGHFEKKIKKKEFGIDLKWRSKVIFGHPNGRRLPFCETKNRNCIVI